MGNAEKVALQSTCKCEQTSWFPRRQLWLIHNTGMEINIADFFCDYKTHFDKWTAIFQPNDDKKYVGAAPCNF